MAPLQLGLRELSELGQRNQLEARSHLHSCRRITRPEHPRASAHCARAESSGFNAGSVDALAGDSGHHGWNPLFVDKYPYAGGPDHYAAYLVNSDGFELELVANP